MSIKRAHIPILAVLIGLLVIFTPIFLARQNWEFIGYIVVIVLVAGLIGLTDKKVNYPTFTLWGLVLWSGMHLAGGGLKIGDGVLYQVILLPISESLGIFRFDQLVHIIGFGVATLVMFSLLRSYTNNEFGPAVFILLVMAGLGVGAVNEIIEFIATLLFPNNGVGGYTNTALDLVADLIGAIIAAIWAKNYMLENKTE